MSTKIDLTIHAVERMCNAVPSQQYEIGILLQERMAIRVADRSGLLRMVPYLKHANAHGGNIYIRPNGEHRYSLIDDLKEEQIEKLSRTGFQPAAIVETSPDNFQVWLKHAQVLEARRSTIAARRLAQMFGGDIGSADWRHFGRLPGFTNQKPRYERNGRFPFVLLRHSKGNTYTKAGQFLPQIEALYKASMEERLQKRLANLSPVQGVRYSFLNIERFRQDPKYQGDLHRADIAFAVAARSLGMPRHLIEAAIMSRDLTKKGPPCRQQDYVARTIEKADGYCFE